MPSFCASSRWVRSGFSYKIRKTRDGSVVATPGYATDFKWLFNASAGVFQPNVFIERLWRSVKYEHVYLHSYDSIADLKAGLKTYFSFFNQECTHQSLARQTPDEVYFAERLRPLTTS